MNKIFIKFFFVFFLFFSTKVYSEPFIPLSEILKEDNPSDIHYVVSRCAGIYMAVYKFIEQDVWKNDATILMVESANMYADINKTDIKTADKENNKLIFQIANQYVDNMEKNKSINGDIVAKSFMAEDLLACKEISDMFSKKY